MPLTIPILDDRRFEDLVAEARAMIPAHAPEWTDHNASDPGITLVELLAYLTETLIYRLDRVTPDQICAFLNLLDNSTIRTPKNTPDLRAAIRATILQLRTIERAVTPDDFELLAQASPVASKIARVRCVPGRNLAPGQTSRADDISVVVLPAESIASHAGTLYDDLKAWLDVRRLVGTRLHVVAPAFVDVTVTAVIVPAAGQSSVDAATRAADALTRFLDPYHGGSDGEGWPFGRGVYMAELIALLSRLPQVGHVESLSLDAPAHTTVSHNNVVNGVPLEPNELVRATAGVSVAS